MKSFYFAVTCYRQSGHTVSKTNYGTVVRADDKQGAYKVAELEVLTMYPCDCFELFLTDIVD